MEEVYMAEIRLKRIVDRTNQEQGNQLSDGDEIMIKDGVGISEFSKEAMGLEKKKFMLTKGTLQPSLRRFMFCTRNM